MTSVGWYHSTPVRASSSPSVEDLVGGRLEDVDPAEAVHLEVDETRDRRGPSDPPGRPTATIAPVVDLDVAANERSVDDGGGDTQSHGA